MRTAAAALAAGLTLALAGCGSDASDGGAGSPPATPTEAATSTGSPTTPDATGVVVKIVIKDGKVTPRGGRIDVEAGQEVTLQISSDAAEEIHVHSDPEHEYEVGPGDAVTKSFTLDTPGQVAVEAHELDATIAQLVVRP